jgi:hypothetical protein
MKHDQPTSSPSLSELPLDELLGYGRSLGLDLPRGTVQGQALRLVRERQELLLGIEREALLDITVWLRQPVRRSAGKEQLAELIARYRPTRFQGLSDRGLRALAALWGIAGAADENRDQLEHRMRRSENVWAKLRRARRNVVGSLVAKTLESADSDGDTYRFLPEDGAPGSLKEEISQVGLVGGVARKLRGVADDYVKEKLDDIETRIDRKLDEIDRRMCEWRDHEVRHRLRILKLTLLFSILVAIISLLYDRF